MGLRKLIRSTFGFSRSQTNGFVVLLPLVTLTLFSEPVYRWWVSQRENDFSKEKAVLDSLSTAWESQRPEENRIPPEEEIPVMLFKFDPNTATADELSSLGFSKQLTRRLVHYREKGGKFRIKSDVRKLYGMDSLFYESLVSFILLPEKMEWVQNENKLATFDKKKREPFDLNKADTSQLKAIDGIGSVLAKRIIKYREKLGGFHDSTQLSEVFGLDSAVVNRLIKSSYLRSDFQLSRININTADEVTLSAHPYSSRKMARAIVAYRFQHGNFQSPDDLRKIDLIDEKVFNKMYPYLTVGEQPANF